MSNLEIVGVRCSECEQMVSAGDNHACWLQEVGMHAFEDAMWARYQAEEAIEPVKTICDICHDKEWIAVCLNCGKKTCNEHTGDSIDGTDYCGFLCTECSSKPAEHITPWSDAKEGDALNTEIGQDCSLCPPGDNGYHQYKIKAGCFVKGHPSCAECASAEEISQSFAAGEIQPLGPADIGNLVDPRREEF